MVEHGRDAELTVRCATAITSRRWPAVFVVCWTTTSALKCASPKLELTPVPSIRRKLPAGSRVAVREHDRGRRGVHEQVERARQRDGPEDERLARRHAHRQASGDAGGARSAARRLRSSVDQAVGEADGRRRHDDVDDARAVRERPLREAEAALEPLAEDGDDDVVARDAEVRRRVSARSSVKAPMPEPAAKADAPS